MITRFTQRRHYLPQEEVANWITHGAATLVAVVGMIQLLLLAFHQGNSWQLIGSAVFGLSMVLLYLASTVYHAVPERLHAAKQRGRRYDQAAIFLLIAGSYTPFILANMRTVVGWSLLAFVWVIALLGIYGELAEKLHSTAIRVGIYLAMGWSAVLATGSIIHVLPIQALVLIGLGGVAYTIGVVFFLWRQLPYHHAIWHLFVIAGTAFHFAAVFYYTL
ncbi:PAQR family membrane homeostasis protein TrhA [Aeoliella mucimassa]|uniref:Hemolysin-III related n=1 Tax=Aeoliella mucimassa TaxID=2527972 RepID=A0A518AVZ0_9BACT|nr:hemolysin III family protein [Aeoliella mucimassa]QDU58909.1 hemolysin-III related [Aeoliella mucimassa]